MKRVVLCIILILCLALPLSGCNSNSPTPTKDEIMLAIQLDTKEDIGLLVINYDADGIEGSGGTSNADKSLLKHDELIYYTLDRQWFEDDSSNTKNLTLQFVVITEYCDPNYDNIYPEEYTKLLEPITFDAEFGKVYSITITGDKTNGYKAALNK